MAILTSKIPKGLDPLEITTKKISGQNKLAFQRYFVARN
jgi:hypothetical protein